MEVWKWRWVPSCWTQSAYYFSITLTMIHGVPRVESFLPSLPVPLAQTISSKRLVAPTLLGSPAQDKPHVGTMASHINDMWPHHQQTVSLSLCGMSNDVSLDIGGDGAVGRPSVILNVVVTGANRGLGFAIAERIACLGHRVVLACRSEPEGRSALERLRARGRARRACFHRLDVACVQSLDEFREICVNGTLHGRVDVLFNNAAVCLPGSDGAVLEKTLAVNFYGALGVMEACLPAMAADTETSLGPTIVWVSSGDGELCYLSSKWQRLFRRAESVEEIASSLSDLLESSGGKDGSDHVLPSEEAETEFAFGQSPAYSLSKAAVNAVVRAWAPHLAAERGVRLVAVCPGDVLTLMMSEEELARGDGVSPEQAALEVVGVALRPTYFLPGKFYRNGKEICW